ncbi:MAG: carbamoyltransferase [Rhodospirillaceae bacterium]|nr:carbamoyltransferase [Rhodospirillaceae bacterium]
MRILGISAFYHDSAAALVVGGNIVAAAQEERFSRLKHDSGFPHEAISFCLSQGGMSFDELDYVVFYDKPFLKFERLLETYLAFAPHGFRSFKMALPVWLREKLFQKNILRDEIKKHAPDFDAKKNLLFSEHHMSHAASAFFPSPFSDAVVLTMDGVGEWATTSAGFGHGNELKIHKEIHFPHSLGLLYSAFTYYTGFEVNSGEYKVMGLAPYGEPKYAQAIFDNLIDLKDDGSFRLDQSYFDYCTGLTMTNAKFDKLFGGPPRKIDDPVRQRDMNLAASVQTVIDEATLRLTRALAKENRSTNLCLAGGVALNCVANGKIVRDGAFENVWIQPAAGDAGGALGAALAAYYMFADQPRQARGSAGRMANSLLGPEFSQSEIEARLHAAGAEFAVLADAELVETVADDIARERVVGWFQGRMEFGPRALGNRSILADPRSRDMQTTLNLKVKFRESFRPFAPSILRNRLEEWFALDCDSPYMLLIADVLAERRLAVSEGADELFGIERLKVARSEVPAVTHVDYSARIQTVGPETNPRYHELLTAFEQRTGCPILINTSFNVRDEPIVCSPEDAFRCFMKTGIDSLAVGNCYLRKEEQRPVPEKG